MGVRVCVRVCVMGGQWKLYDLESNTGLSLSCTGRVLYKGLHKRRRMCSQLHLYWERNGTNHNDFLGLADYIWHMLMEVNFLSDFPQGSAMVHVSDRSRIALANVGAVAEVREVGKATCNWSECERAPF